MLVLKLLRKTKNTLFPIVLTIFFILTFLTCNTSVSTAAMIDDKEQAYEKVIAHGGGAYKGYETTNTVEAIKNSIQNGYTMIELDLELSSDEKIIMLHDWDKTAGHYFGRSFERVITEREFSNLKVHNQFEVMTFDKLIKILKDTPGIKIITDIKKDNIKILDKIASEYPEFKDRIIPQIYEYNQLKPVKELGYQDVIFTLYTRSSWNLDELSCFVLENDVFAVTMPDYFADKGYCKKLSDMGIKVYVHPVDSFEKAAAYINKGAYGVYSGTLLPQEFFGLEKDYYLLSLEQPQNYVKLTDEYIDGLKDLRIKGLKTGEKVRYSVNQKKAETSVNTKDLIEGKNSLTIQIYSNQGELIGKLDYFIWIDSIKNDQNKVRILHKKYEYRLDGRKQTKNFNTVMEEQSAPAEVIEILRDSLIAKSGDYRYYNNGIASCYLNNKEYLPVQKGRNGKTLLPLESTALELGASSVKMEKGKDLVIDYDGKKIRSVANSFILRIDYKIFKIKLPVEVYMNKAMAGGEIYEYITGRKYIEEKGIVIILPINTNANNKKQLIQAANELYN